MKNLWLIAPCLMLLALAPQDHEGSGNAGGQSDDASVSARGWSDPVIEQIERLPVQEGGRVKPFHTFANFTLLRFHGSRRLSSPEGQSLSPVEWLLDVLLRPASTTRDELFLVQNGEVIEAIGLPLGAAKGRTKYSYEALWPALVNNKLFELASQYVRIEEKQRSPVQSQVILLASNVSSYDRLLSEMSWAYVKFEVPAGDRVSALFEGRKSVGFHDIVKNSVPMLALRQELDDLGDAASMEQSLGILEMLSQAVEAVRYSNTLAFLPPVASVDAEAEWMTAASIFSNALQGMPVAEVYIDALAGWEAAAATPDDDVVVAHALSNVVREVSWLADARGEGGSLDLELRYYKLDLLTWSLSLFVLAFITCAILWMRPRSKLAYRTTWIFAGSAYTLLVAAIVMRCVIRSRPPVSTLYETVLFVAATGGLSALFVEWVNRRRIALSAATIMGMGLLFIANGYEMLDKRDTMPSLVAVLDTNFWLATHVTTITMGYAAGMLAALLGSIWVVSKVFRLKRHDPSFYKGLSRMIYGVICFAATLSIVGTILGGIWANDSWGRFWGWDPKENGALMIVIWQVAMLHGRMAGLLRDKGFALAAAFGGTVIAFSWWGVNLLGIGLHSYGFTSGIHSALWTYYGIQWAVVALGLIAVRGGKPALSK